MVFFLFGYFKTSDFEIKISILLQLFITENQI